MIGANQYVLTWDHFMEIHADKRVSFENLCRSLFQRKMCEEGVILHSEPNHPGVEVAPVRSKDGRKLISFQAKFFDSNIGYAQIKESANRAICHYKGKLEQIYLYCNKDINTKRAAYIEIEKMLNDAGIELIPVTGQTILDYAVDYPTILSCYFGLDCIDDAWFEKNLQISLDSLGKRYNSLFNVDTEAQNNLSIFLREPEGISIINAKKRELLEELKKLRWRCLEKYKTDINTIQEVIELIPDISKDTIADALKWAECLEDRCEKIFDKLKNEKEMIYKELSHSHIDNSKIEELRNKEFVIERLLMLPESLCFTKQEQSFINNQVLLVTGEMGTGKSQLLATAARRVANSKRPTLLLLGQTYISDNNIGMQIMNGLEGVSADESFESMLAVMDEKSLLTGNSAVIFIDAINESKNRNIWKIGIDRIIALIAKYANVKLVISLRTGFETFTLSDNVLEKQKKGDISSIVHYGLADDSPSSIYEFLSNYGVPFSPEYYLQSEMTNPLFLTWFCQTYSGEEQGLDSLIETVLELADKEASIEAGFQEPTRMLKPLFYELIDVAECETVTLQTLLKLAVWEIYGVTNKISYIRAMERSGVLVSYVRNQEEIFYIGYNLLEDYLKATRIIEREQEKDKIIKYCKNILLGIDGEGKIVNYGNESIFAMVTSLFAIKFKEECIGIVDDLSNDWDKNQMVAQYLRTFAWRSSFVSFDDFLNLINKYPVSPKQVWDVFIENATKEECELNALGLTKLLNGYELNRRDYLWTTEINSLNEYDRVISLAYFIEEGNEFNGLSDSKAFLLGVLYSWMLSSTNRTLRDRISKALVEILKRHFSICIQLLSIFKDVNDPYIIQRLYGVVFGAVMKRNVECKKEFEDLAHWIYTEIFSGEMVYPDVLLRDYARLIVERFVYEYPERTGGIDIFKIRPPYKSEPIPFVEEVDYCDEKYHIAGMWQLMHSMKFDMCVKGVGLYGDFGRYTFQTALNDFVDVDVANVYYYAMEYIINKLGYRNEFFGDYDSKIINIGRHDTKKIERIGKKYQWIAMYNILARLSDTHNVKDGGWNDKIGTIYQGPWNPHLRDFDPTLNTRIKSDANLPKFNLRTYTNEGFLPIDASETDIDEWLLESDILFQNMENRLIYEDESGQEWVSMYFYEERKIRPKDNYVAVMGFPMGEQQIWSIVSMYIVKNIEGDLTETKLRETNFIKYCSSDTMNSSSLFNREYAWSPGYKAEFETDVYDDEVAKEIEIDAIPSSINILWEKQYDASQDEVTSFMIPTGEIIQEMSLYQKDVDGVYYFEDEIAAFDLSIVGNEHKKLIIRKELLDKYIKKTGIKVFWTVVGEKQYFLGGHNQKWQRREGYFVYHKNGIEGSIDVVDNI